MKSQAILFILCTLILSSFSQAFPFFKRDIKYVTQVQDVYETVKVVTTVVVDFVPALPTLTAVGSGNNQPTNQAFTSPTAQPTFSFAVPSMAPTVSSHPQVIPQPTATTVEQDIPSPSSASPAPLSTTPAAPPPKSEDSVTSNGMSYGIAKAGTSYTGKLTWYTVDNMGSCGGLPPPGAPVVAIPPTFMDAYMTSNPNDNPLCNKKINIFYGGKTYSATVIDTCPGCADNHLDLSHSLFTTMTGDADVGVINNAHWEWA